MAVPKPPCDGCTKIETNMFSFPCIECSSTNNYRHFEWDAPSAGRDGRNGEGAGDLPEGVDEIPAQMSEGMGEMVDGILAGESGSE